MSRKSESNESRFSSGKFTEIDELLKHIRFRSDILASQIKEYGEKFIKEKKADVNRS